MVWEAPVDCDMMQTLLLGRNLFGLDDPINRIPQSPQIVQRENQNPTAFSKTEKVHRTHRQAYTEPDENILKEG